MLAVHTARTAALLLLLAGPAEAHGPFHELIAAATERVSRQPDDADGYLRRGELYRQHGDIDSALADFDRAARLAPGSDTPDLLRGRALVDGQRARQAKVYLDRFVSRHPESAAGFSERARAALALGDAASGAADWERAIARLTAPTPDDYLARLNAQLAARLDTEALRGLDEAIERLGPLVSLERPAIELELRARRYDAALGRVDRLAAQSPRQESFHVRRGEILLAAGRRTEARRQYSAALAAIAALPPHLRATQATVDLEAKARDGLAALQRRAKPATSR
jgi:predicted Zn-dependent protease